MPDLCDLADVRAFLRKQNADPDEDILQLLIPAASDVIINYCSRDFTASSETRRFRVAPPRTPSGISTVELLASDLRSISSIVLGPDDASPTTLAVGTYALSGGPGILGTYSRVLIAASQSITGTETWSSFGFSDVDIQGTWGPASIPDVVKQACVVTVADWYRQKVAAFSRTFDESGIYTKPASLPDAVCGWLDPFKRYVVA